MFTIWHDQDYDLAFWVYKNSFLRQREERTVLRTLPKTNSPKTLLNALKNHYDFLILPLIKYEGPDIILQHVDEGTKESKILFVTEFMTHTPQWQHPAQRFSRIYGSSQLGIPVSLVLPGVKIKLERGRGLKYKETRYVCSPAIYSLFLKTSLMNKTPTLTFHWPDVSGYLEVDQYHPTAPSLKGDILDWFRFLELAVNEECSLSNEFVQKQLKRIESKQEKVSVYNYDTISGIYDTEKAISRYKLDENKLSTSFLCNKQSLVFEPTGLAPPTSYFRTDPYAGMLCAFDNLFCRDENGKRVTNIILRARDIKLSYLVSKGTFIDKDGHDIENCPFKSFSAIKSMKLEEVRKHITSAICPYTSSKQQRVYGEVADLIIFDDSVYYRGW